MPNTSDAKILSEHSQSAAFGGLDTQFNLFLPGNAALGKVTVLFYLAGLESNEDTGLFCVVLLLMTTLNE